MLFAATCRPCGMEKILPSWLFPCALQALSIPTKINKGTVEIVSHVKLITAGDKVGASEATLLAKLGIKPFEYGLVIQQVYFTSSCVHEQCRSMKGLPDESLTQLATWHLSGGICIMHYVQKLSCMPLPDFWQVWIRHFLIAHQVSLIRMLTSSWQGTRQPHCKLITTSPLPHWQKLLGRIWCQMLPPLAGDWGRFALWSQDFGHQGRGSAGTCGFCNPASRRSISGVGLPYLGINPTLCHQWLQECPGCRCWDRVHLWPCWQGELCTLCNYLFWGAWSSNLAIFHLWPFWVCIGLRAQQWNWLGP